MVIPAKYATPHEASLGKGIKAGYGVAEIGISGIELMLQVYLLELYLRVGLSPLWAGVALTLAVAWDAVSDPLMGALSDRAGKGGSANRRRLFSMLLGSVFLAVAFIALFSPQEGSSQGLLFAYLLCWYLVLNTALTMVGVPHLALINDLASSKEERADLFGWRLAMGGVGLLLGLSLPSLVAAAWHGASADSGVEQYLRNRSVVGWALGLVGTAGCALTVAIVWKRLMKVEAKFPSDVSTMAFFEGIKLVVSSRVFRVILIGFAFISVGRALNASLALIFYKVTLVFDEAKVGAMLLALSLSIMAATPVWIALSRRYSKGNLCIGGIVLLAVLGSIVYPLFPEKLLWPVLAFAIVGGFLVASVVLLESLLSDVVEKGQRDFGGNLAGASYGLWRMVMKISQAVGISITALFLYIVGYEQGVVGQSQLVARSVAWAYGPGVALFFLAGAYSVWRASKLMEERDERRP